MNNFSFIDRTEFAYFNSLKFIEKQLFELFNSKSKIDAEVNKTSHKIDLYTKDCSSIDYILKNAREKIIEREDQARKLQDRINSYKDKNNLYFYLYMPLGSLYTAGYFSFKVFFEESLKNRYLFFSLPIVYFLIFTGKKIVDGDFNFQNRRVDLDDLKKIIDKIDVINKNIEQNEEKREKKFSEIEELIGDKEKSTEDINKYVDNIVLLENKKKGIVQKEVKNIDMHNFLMEIMEENEKYKEVDFISLARQSQTYNSKKVSRDMVFFESLVTLFSQYPTITEMIKKDFDVFEFKYAVFSNEEGQELLPRYEEAIGYEGIIAKQVKNFLTVSQGTETNSEAHKNFVLFFGPPGTGKTNLVNNIIAKYVEDTKEDYNTYFFKLTLNDIRAPHHLGVLKDQVLKIGKEEKNKVIIFFDELDGLIKNRAHAESSDKDQSIVTEFLQFLDDCKTKSHEHQNVFFIACTNYINNVDQAALRRLCQFQIGLPSYSLRKNIVSELFTKINDSDFTNSNFLVDKNCFINIVTVLTAGFSCDGIKKRINSLFFCEEDDQIDYWEKLLSFFSMKQYENLNAEDLMGFAIEINDGVMQSIDNRVPSIQNISLLGQENYRLLVDLSDELHVEKEKEETILSLMKEYINQSKTLFEASEKKIESVVGKLILSQEEISKEYIKIIKDGFSAMKDKNQFLKEVTQTIKKGHGVVKAILIEKSKRDNDFKEMYERFNALSEDLIKKNEFVMDAVNKFVDKINDKEDSLEKILDSFYQLPQVLKDAVQGIANTERFLLSEYKENKESAIQQQQLSMNIMQDTFSQFTKGMHTLNSCFQSYLKQFEDNEKLKEKEHKIEIKEICKRYSENIARFYQSVQSVADIVNEKIQGLKNEIGNLKGEKKGILSMKELIRDESDLLPGMKS